MGNRRATLFYTVIAVFAATAIVTLLALIGVVRIEDKYLGALVTALLIEVAAAVIGLFKGHDLLGSEHTAQAAETIEGAWWQFVRTDADKAVSFVTVRYSNERQQILLEGETYSADGDEHARWWSIAASLNATSCELYYFWRGDHSTSDGEFSGVGFVRFEEPPRGKSANRATGWYTSGNLEQLALTARRKVEMHRASEKEASEWAVADASAKRRLARSAHAARVPQRPERAAVVAG